MLSEKSIFLNVNLRTQDEVFDFIGRTAQSLGVTNNEKMLVAELKKREKDLSTGLMDGFAIPHAKCDLVLCPTIIYIRTKEPVTWKMQEGKGAQHFFTLLVPSKDAGKVHLEMISKIAVCLLEQEFRDEISHISNTHDMFLYLKKSLNTE
jgi:PTS system fructose-specific IIA component